MSTAATPETTAASAPATRPVWAQRLLGPLYVTGMFWWRAIMLVAWFPEWLIWFNIQFWTCFFFVFLRHARRMALANLEPVLGPCGFLERQRRVFRTFNAHAWRLFERFEQFRPWFVPEVEVVGDAWRDVATGERGCVLVTAHLGSWEIAPLVRLPGATRQRMLHLVREPEDGETTQRLLRELLANHPSASYQTHFAGDDPQLGATLLYALRRGDIVTLAGDRPRAGQATLRARMFGRTVELPAGPPVLARAAEVPLLPIFAFRTGRRRYRLEAREPIHVPQTADRDADLQSAADRIAAEVEAAVRTAPHDWSRWEVVWC